MKHLNARAFFFIVFENLQTIQICIVGNQERTVFTVLSLAKYNQFHQTNILHNHGGLIKPFETLFTNYIIDTFEHLVLTDSLHTVLTDNPGVINLD